MNWYRLPPYEVMPETLYNFTPEIWVKLSKAERDLLCHFLGYMKESFDKTNSHKFLSQEGQYLPVGGFFDEVYNELLAKLAGDTMTEAAMIAGATLKNGMTDCDCEANKLTGAERDYNTLTPTEYDIKCRKLTLLYDVVVGILSEIVTMHQKYIDGLDNFLIASGASMSLGVLFAGVSGGLSLIPTGIIAGALYLYSQQVAMSLLVKNSWADALNYVQNHKCELINVMMLTNSATQLREELLGELEDILQMFSMPVAAWGKVLFAELAPNSLFSAIFNFVEDVTIAGVECGCQDDDCLYQYAPDGALTKAEFIRHVDVLTGEILPAISLWGTNVVHEAKYYAGAGNYRMDIVYSNLLDGDIVFELSDAAVEIQAIFNGSIIPPFGQLHGGLELDISRDEFPATPIWETNRITEENLNCIFRHGWQAKVLSISSAVSFRVKFKGSQ